MITIHPEFDTITNTWFWDEFEAKTIRELKRLVGGQVHIKDYYPNGFGGAVILRMRENEERRAVRVTPPTVSVGAGNFSFITHKRKSNDKPMTRRVHRAGGQKVRNKHDHDQVLDLWASGLSSDEIAPKCGGGLTADGVRAIVVRSRKYGDPRAVRRISKDI